MKEKTPKKVSYSKFLDKASEYIQNKKGEMLQLAHIKGEGQGYYWSPTDKKLILVPRAAEYYLLPWKKDEMGRSYLFLPYLFASGIIISVPEEELVLLGYN